jgi:adenylate cyclase
LALQCDAAVRKGGYIGKDADAGYRLCEQALAADPNNVLALNWLSSKFWGSVINNLSADREGDLKRSDELAAKVLAVDPNDAFAHFNKAWILRIQGRLDESIAEAELVLVLNPALISAYGPLAWNYQSRAQFEKSLEIIDKAIRRSPLDRELASWYHARAAAHFGLKQYDQAIESARRSVALNPNTNPWSHVYLIATFALTGHEADAREALQNYLASVPSGPKTIAAWKMTAAPLARTNSDPRYLETFDRRFEGLRKAGMPEE